jgi:dTDP-4-amino-4,6-dideoxygalactose transaminase
VFADIGDELNISATTVEAVLTRKTKAIIVPHLFGNPADIEAIINLTRGRKISIIDDAAQALGATIAGQPVGSFGAAGIVSFGSGKVCSGIGGGAIVLRNKENLKTGALPGLPRPAFSSALRNLLHKTIWHRWRRWTLPVYKALSKSAATSPDLPPSPYSQENMANVQAAVASDLLRTLQDNLTARRARVQAYRELLGPENRLSLLPHKTGSACLTQVVRVLSGGCGDERSARLIDTLASAGYEIQGSYIPIHLLPDYGRWVRKALPNAETVWRDLVELPCEPDVKLEQVESISAIVKQSLD